MRFASLGSGSRGNATLVQHDGACLLVDCGFSAREAERRLALLGIAPGQIDAILVTHEHTDHCSGVGRLSRRHELPVYMTRGTRASGRCGEVAACHPLRSEQRLEFGAIAVTPVAVPHDAREPCQFVFQAGSAKLGLLTDLGSVTPLVLRHYSGCQALVLECNHDRRMLERGPYPPALKRRIAGRLGHLSNEQAGELLRSLPGDPPARLVVAHVSERNNCREAVLDTLARERRARADIVWAEQDSGFGWLEVAPRGA